ncbi:MAG: N-methyl-L-tryptophan oxidase, partial [Pseudolabrys sp.]|nr:N-methyl-L-tryptophan oxidase [Pseudolabrys sp.]
VYTQFARRSHEIWRALEGETGKALFVQNGLLVISGPGKRAAAHGNPDFLQSTIEIAQQNSVAHETLVDAQIRDRFPAFNIANGDRAYFEPEAGLVRPEECVRTQLALAQKSGATIRAREIMTRFDPRPSHVEVVTDRGSYRGDNIVVAAGPWIPEVLPQRSALFTIRRQLLAWFRITKDAALYAPDRFPVWYWQIPRDKAIYGFPWIDTVEPAMKVSAEQYDTTTTADTVERDVTRDEIDALYDGYVGEFFRGVSRDCVKSAICLYTCVDDARFLVDRLPGNPRVIVASPCSGHGFKHSAAIGEAIAELAITGTTSRVSLEHFRFRT